MRRKLICVLGIIVALALVLLGYYKFFVIGGEIVKVDADLNNGFNFAYYMFLPYGMFDITTDG